MADASTNTQYAYIVRTPGVVGGEARIAGHRIRVRDIVAARDLGGLTPEEIAVEYDLPMEAVLEAIAYCQSNPPEIRQDWEREEAMMEASGMNDPNYKYNPQPRLLTAEELARLKSL